MNNLGLQRKLETEIENLLRKSEELVVSQCSIRDIEKDIMLHLIKLGLALLTAIIQEKNTYLQTKKIKIEKGFENKGNRDRKYLSLFGELTINRKALLSNELGMIYPLDEYLELPRGTKWSYNLQEIVGESASENDFRESVRVINKLLPLNLSGKSSERNANSLGNFIDDYYETRPVETEKTALCFSASFDGKGVPKIKKKPNPKARRKKGEKPNVMQMATVSVTSCFEPKKQTVEGILNGLMGPDPSNLKVVKSSKKLSKTNDNRWHQKIHKRAFLAAQKKGVDYGIRDIQRRMQNPNSRFVVPIDAGIGLEDIVLKSIKKYKLEAQFDGIILDIIHVTEYVWNVANAFLGEKSNQRSNWVRLKLTKILNGQTAELIKEFEQIIIETKLTKAKREQIQKTITYFTNHQHKMEYDKFITKGYPVSSAIVESTCKHLVKERMEQSGMRWSFNGAQDIMDLRAVKLNEDMEDFIDFVIKKERKPIKFSNKAA